MQSDAASHILWLHPSRQCGISALNAPDPAPTPGASVPFGSTQPSQNCVHDTDQLVEHPLIGMTDAAAQKKPVINSYDRAVIAKRGFLLSRGHRADLATTRPKRFELWPGSRALQSFKTVNNNTFENRRMHQCWWGGCGHVMALHSMPAEWANGFGSGCAHFWRQSH